MTSSLGVEFGSMGRWLQLAALSSFEAHSTTQTTSAFKHYHFHMDLFQSSYLHIIQVAGIFTYYLCWMLCMGLWVKKWVPTWKKVGTIMTLIVATQLIGHLFNQEIIFWNFFTILMVPHIYNLENYEKKSWILEKKSWILNFWHSPWG